MLSYSTYEEIEPELKVYSTIDEDNADFLITNGMSIDEITDLASSRIVEMLIGQISKNIENQKKSHKLIS